MAHDSRRQLEVGTRRARRRRGFSLMELLIVVAILLIIMAIAVPNFMAAKNHAQDMAAIRQIDTIHAAQAQYQAQFGSWAKTLVELGPPATGEAGPGGANLIPGDLAKGAKTGYVFTLRGSEQGYVIQAAPQVFGSTGRRTFYSDETLVKRQNWGKEMATAASEEIK